MGEQLGLAVANAKHGLETACPGATSIYHIVMTKRIGICLATLFAAITSVPSSSARIKEEPPKPGFYCSVGKAFDDQTWGTATLDAAGVVQESDWTWRIGRFDTPFSLLIFGGAASFDGNRLTDAGTAFLQWNLMPDARKSPQKRFVQLTSSWQRGFSWSAFGTGRAEKTWPPGLMIYWPDLLAFARSASALNFYLLDDHGKFLAAQTLDREVFLKAELETNATVTALNAKIANFQSQCDKVDDIINRDIII